MSNRDEAIRLHREWAGKISTEPKMKLATRENLAIAYTPGVAEPCKDIAADEALAYDYTLKGNTIAVVSDGSAVLGLGNIGAAAAMPVMEGKAVLFKEFGGVNAFPICLDTQREPTNTIPPISGIIKSVMIKSGTSSSAFCRPILPFSA